MQADIYALACMAFELLFGELLFDAEDETALVSLHVSHDGWPARLVELGAHSKYSDLAIVFAACLRHDPRQRPNAAEVRGALRSARAKLGEQTWPLGAGIHATDLSA
jgi:serine/threonine protein kinase